METVVRLGCYLISCLICIFIAVQFMEERYRRRYRDRQLYIGVQIAGSVLLTCINYLENPALNYFSWLSVIAVCAGVLYQEEHSGFINRVLESEAFFIAIAFTETMGVLLIDWMVPYTDITDPLLLKCMEVLFSKVLILFFYYKVVRLFLSERFADNSRGRYMAFSLILIYCSASMLAIMTDFFRRLDFGIVAINLACIVFVDLYLLSFLKSKNEKRQYEEKFRMQEQQVKLQYEYYARQEQKYNETLRILHDVNKHIHAIGELSATGDTAQTKDYAEQIRTTLKPLVPENYTDNPIFNILLADKLRQTKDKGIRMEIRLNGVSFRFMEAMDITTIFGNLLDNSVEACDMLPDTAQKEIRILAKKVREMVAVTIQNSSAPVVWKNGMPVSEKGENRGIGLLNVQKSISKYDGSLKMREEDGMFIAEFFISA